MLSALKDFVGIKPRSYTLSVPRIEENEGLLLLGDPGTGKSQVIHQLLDNIAKRKPQEAVVVYDPAGEFIEKHFDPDEDIVLNPLDARCPYWMPSYEGTWGYENCTDKAVHRGELLSTPRQPRDEHSVLYQSRAQHLRPEC